MSNRRRLRRSPSVHGASRPAAGVASGHFDCGCSHLAVLDVACPRCGHEMTSAPVPSSGAVGDLREISASCFRCGDDFEALAVISAVL